jgi:hypothetical protein
MNHHPRILSTFRQAIQNKRIIEKRGGEGETEERRVPA